MEQLSNTTPLPENCAYSPEQAIEIIRNCIQALDSKKTNTQPITNLAQMLLITSDESFMHCVDALLLRHDFE